MSLRPQMGALSWEELSQISRCAFHSFPLVWQTGFQRLAGSVRPGVSKSFWMPVSYQTAIKCYFPRLDRFIHCILRTLHPGKAFKIAISSKFRRLGLGSVLPPWCRADPSPWCCSTVHLRSWSKMQLKEHFLWLLICWMPSLKHTLRRLQLQRPAESSSRSQAVRASEGDGDAIYMAFSHYWFDVNTWAVSTCHRNRLQLVSDVPQKSGKVLLIFRLINSFFPKTYIHFYGLCFSHKEISSKIHLSFNILNVKMSSLFLSLVPTWLGGDTHLDKLLVYWQYYRRSLAIFLEILEWYYSISGRKIKQCLTS